MYLNVEQSAKTVRDTSLSQLGIDRAFAGKQRQSNLSFENKELMVTILAGKNTGRAGVEPIAHSAARRVQVTNLERTLIDIAVRPAYAGGIDQVLAAYRAARERVQEAVQRLCIQVVDELDLSHKANFDKCVDENLSKAQVDIQALAAKKSGGPNLLGNNR